ncbi:MAG: sugar transferase [Candidatus Cyclonatronum sp.]|uniref:sugar transferase n=1 Tax=Cyclonatronum sp. TaxID=3024185 RepID=UPI0025BF9BC4|nr:sugar transferase [Cyclonatronum sp.]MCH8487518.1 sugar transferase [Cyclonatronum sp.]
MFIKRLTDITISLLLLLPALPVMVVVAVLIKLDSRGPVLFRQQRIGQGRRPFEIYKFRTMTHRDAAAIDQHAEKVIEGNDDVRITRMGRLLRVTSLDELPQLLNILKGEMSLIGPRPVLPEQLAVVPPWLQDRFAVKPGVTGLAQVKGRRSLSWEQQLCFDKIYAGSAGILSDLKILAETVMVVLTGKGIYGEAGKNWRAYRGMKDAEWESYLYDFKEVDADKILHGSDINT